MVQEVSIIAERFVENVDLSISFGGAVGSLRDFRFSLVALTCKALT